MNQFDFKTLNYAIFGSPYQIEFLKVEPLGKGRRKESYVITAPAGYERYVECIINHGNWADNVVITIDLGSDGPLHIMGASRFRDALDLMYFFDREAWEDYGPALHSVGAGGTDKS